MELKQIKELMAAMGRTGTKRLTLKKEGMELEIERGDNGVFRGELPLDASESPAPEEFAQRRTSAALSRAKDTTGSLGGTPHTPHVEEGSFHYVTSPMVGTFYASPSPDDPAFIKVGEKIDKATIVCIIEAMKVMNEVKSGVEGTVVEVLVENGHPVEFGTKLFRINPVS